MRALSAIIAATPEDAPYLSSDEAQAILRAVEARFRQEPPPTTLVAEINRLVPGWRTSEFWMTALGHAGLVLAATAGVLPVQYAALAGALSQVAYNLSRGLAKGGQGR